MDQKYKLDRLCQAFQSLPEDKRNQFLDAKKDDAEYQLFLSGILSELEMLKGGAIDQSEASNRTKQSRPKKKMIPSATKKTENNSTIGTVLKKVIIEGSQFAVIAIGSLGLLKFILFKAKQEAIRHNKLEFDEDMAKFGDALRKVVDDLKVGITGKGKDIADGSHSL